MLDREVARTISEGGPRLSEWGRLASCSRPCKPAPGMGNAFDAADLLILWKILSDPERGFTNPRSGYNPNATYFSKWRRRRHGSAFLCPPADARGFDEALIGSNYWNCLGRSWRASPRRQPGEPTISPAPHKADTRAGGSFAVSTPSLRKYVALGYNPAHSDRRGDLSKNA